VMRLASNPVARIRRRFVKGGPAELRWRAGVTGVRRAFDEVIRGDGAPAPEVVCLDVIDYAVAAELVASGRVRAGAGGIAWLADQWSATQPDQPPARQPAG